MILALSWAVEAQLKTGFYSTSCPKNVEFTLKKDFVIINVCLVIYVAGIRK